MLTVEVAFWRARLARSGIISDDQRLPLRRLAEWDLYNAEALWSDCEPEKGTPVIPLVGLFKLLKSIRFRKVLPVSCSLQWGNKSGHFG